MTDTLRERVARALWEAQCEHWQPYRAKLQASGKLCDYPMLSDGRQRELMREADAAIALVLEEAAKVVTEHYQELCTEHRLLLVSRAAAIRALKEKK